MTNTKDNGDPMAKAIASQSGAGKPQIDAAEAARLQVDIDAKATATNRAISDDEMATIRKMQEEQAERERLRPSPPVIRSVSAARARPGERTVTMIFPNALFIWTEPTAEYPARQKVDFGKGPQEVPESLVDNWYLGASGVKRYEGVADRRDPTIQQWVAAGYKASNYPKEYHHMSSQADIDAAIAAEKSA